MKNNINYNQPLVSIIIDTISDNIVDCLSTLNECSYKNIEVIINDSFKNNSYLKSNSYLKNKIYFCKNDTVCKRAAAYKETKGEMVCYIDSNDIIDPAFIELMVKGISDSVDFSYCNYDVFYKTPKISLYEKPVIHDYYSFLNNCLLSDTQVAPMSIFMFKREFLDKIVSNNKNIDDDFVFLYEVINSFSNYATYFNQTLYHKRESPYDYLQILDGDSSQMTKIHFLIDSIKNKNAHKDVFIDYATTIALSPKWQHPYSLNRIHYIRKIAFLNMTIFRDGWRHAKFIIHYLFPLFTLLFLSKNNRIGFWIKIQMLILRPRVIYMGSAINRNLGDHAIFLAAKRLLKDNKIKMIELSQKELTPYILKSLQRKNIVIGLRGGGNIGNTYPHEERFHRYVIANLSKNKIFFFPESIFFSNDTNGYDEALLSSTIYKQNKDLKIFLRDTLSLERANKIFNNHLEYCPDIVFYLKNKYYVHKKIKKALIILRDDLEKDSKISDEIISACLKDKKVSIDYSTMITSNTIPKRKRAKLISQKLKEISSYDLIITDRLHAMIFSYISGIPTIVKDNKTNKLSPVVNSLYSSNIVFLFDKNKKYRDISSFLISLETIDERPINFSDSYKSIINYIKE